MIIKKAPKTNIKILIAKIPEPIAGWEEYWSIPNKSKGNPINMRIIEKKIANACGSAIKIIKFIY